MTPFGKGENKRTRETQEVQMAPRHETLQSEIFLRWRCLLSKPPRAHHCSARLAALCFFSPFWSKPRWCILRFVGNASWRWITIVLGSTTVWASATTGVWQSSFFSLVRSSFQWFAVALSYDCFSVITQSRTVNRYFCLFMLYLALRGSQSHVRVQIAVLSCMDWGGVCMWSCLAIHFSSKQQCLSGEFRHSVRLYKFCRLCGL